MMSVGTGKRSEDTLILFKVQILSRVAMWTHVRRLLSGMNLLYEREVKGRKGEWYTTLHLDRD